MNRLLKFFKSFVYRIESIERWIAYRTYEKYHIIKTELPKTYFTYEERLYNACFSLLVDHVEIELAAYADPELSDLPDFKEILLRRIPRFWILDYILPPHRSSKYGIRVLEARINDPYKSEYYDTETDKKKAGQVLELYKWWKFERPKRQDPLEVYGLYKFCREMDQKYDGDFHKWTPVGNGYVEMGLKLNEEENEKYKAIIDLASKLEEYNQEEDNIQLRRLIELRMYWGS